MTNKRAKSISFKQIIQLLIVPAGVWMVMEMLTRTIVGVSVIANPADMRTLFRSLASTFCFALALNCNVPMGRMDLSTGSQVYLSCILGGNIALGLGFGGVGILVCSMIVGALAGFLVGLVFIKLRILPMVLGLGMTLIYECISFAIYKQQGLMLFGKPGVAILSNAGFIIVVSVLIILFITYMFQFSDYGYKRRAIRGNQKLAIDSGVNIYINCLICYIIAGTLLAVSGIFDTAYKGTLMPVLGMTSNGNTFYNMFPMQVGIWLGLFIGNTVIGIFASSISLNILIIGLSKLRIDSSIQTVIIFSIFLLFMIYRMNEEEIKYNKVKRLRKKEALARRKELNRLPAQLI